MKFSIEFTATTTGASSEAQLSLLAAITARKIHGYHRTYLLKNDNDEPF
jgi:hypothetical protein